MRLFIVFAILFGFALKTNAQASALIGHVSSGLKPVAYASVKLIDGKTGTTSDSLGNYSLTNLKPGKHIVSISALGYSPFKRELIIRENEMVNLDVDLKESDCYRRICSNRNHERGQQAGKPGSS